jgi:hypothetical protein
MKTQHLAPQANRLPGWRRRRAWAKLLAWLMAPVGLVAAAFQLQPAHIRLDIPVPQNPVGYFWYETQRSQLAYADETGVLYLTRQAGTGYAEPQGWHTIEDAFATFDRWFRSNGWTQAGAPGLSDPVLPESRLLAPGNLRTYYRAGHPSQRAALAIWKPAGPVHAIHVVLVTSRPSWLMRIFRGLD